MNDRGFILLESLLSLTLVSFLALQLLPFFTQGLGQMQASKVNVECLRKMHDASLESTAQRTTFLLEGEEYVIVHQPGKEVSWIDPSKNESESIRFLYSD